MNAIFSFLWEQTAQSALKMIAFGGPEIGELE